MQSQSSDKTECQKQISFGHFFDGMLILKGALKLLLLVSLSMFEFKSSLDSNASC